PGSTARSGGVAAQVDAGAPGVPGRVARLRRDIVQPGLLRPGRGSPRGLEDHGAIQVAVVQVDRGGAGSVAHRDHGVVRGSVYPGEVRQSGALVRAGTGDGGLRGEPDQSRFRVPGRQDRRRYLVARLRLRPRTGSARVGSSGSLVGLSARGGRPRGAEQASVLQNVQRMVREEETWLVFT